MSLALLSILIKQNKTKIQTTIKQHKNKTKKTKQNKTKEKKAKTQRFHCKSPVRTALFRCLAGNLYPKKSKSYCLASLNCWFLFLFDIACYVIMAVFVDTTMINPKDYITRNTLLRGDYCMHFAHRP